MMKHFVTGSIVAAALLLSGCSGDNIAETTAETTTETTEETRLTGYLVDSAVANADYDCVADGEYNNTTGRQGEFQCRDMSRVRFRIGELILGEITSLPADGYVFPQDLVGEDNASHIRLAQLLQSLDEDNNVTNGISIPDEIKEALPEGNFTPQEVTVYLEAASVEYPRSETEAWEHLHTTVQELRGQNSGAGGNGHGAGGAGSGIVDVNTTPLSTLTQELKDAIAYMGNEERLAHDVYLNLYEYHAAAGTEIFQLKNIAENSETRHIQTVQALVQKYNLTAEDLTNVTAPVGSSSLAVADMPSGRYDIPAIQALYDMLYAKGQNSQQDALEVGCMVEVTDINDLNEKIVLAQESNASDVETAFTALRNASYNHYWSFDSGLKQIGVAEGCCSIGTVDGVNYCQPDYPQNSHGGSAGTAGGQGNGRGGGHN